MDQLDHISITSVDLLCQAVVGARPVSRRKNIVLTVLLEKDERWLWRAPVFGDSASAARFETWVQKRHLNWGLNRKCTVLQVECTGWIFMAFPHFNALGAKPGRNPILVLACSMEKYTSKTQLEEHSMGDCQNKCDENSKFDPFMAKC